jgi:hypothetical protein
VTHSSYKSLLVAFAISSMVVGCAIAPESETAQESNDLTIDHANLKPDVEKPAIAATAKVAPPQATVFHPGAPPRVLDGPKPNPWDGDGTNTNTGTSGTGTGSNTK